MGSFAQQAGIRSIPKHEAIRPLSQSVSALSPIDIGAQTILCGGGRPWH